ncbi:MAG: peptidoglycan bridge formation glycyltransferase FemA/FemB family protein [Chitinivibrionales bacterium]|nr:peptidoglycan bridge formation glycyltransferase FemA/FemB family protein [Chitinivibrionales bacterium]
MFTLPISYAYTATTLSQHEWTSILSQFSDASICQSWEYGAVRWGSGALHHILLKKNQTVVAAAQVRLLKLPMIPVRMAYIATGPVWKPRFLKPDHQNYRLILAALAHEYCVKQNSSFIVLKSQEFKESNSAISAISRDERFYQLSHFFSPNRQTIFVDLRPTEEELRKQLDKKWRHSLKCAEKEELAIAEGYDDKLFTTFIGLYTELKKSKGFIGVDVEEFKKIQSMSDKNNRMRITICYHQGRPVSGSVCSLMGDTVIGLLSATNAEGRKVRAYYLLQWDEILWARKAGALRYDLNGINPKRNPSVYHFKAGLNGVERTFAGVFFYGKTLFHSWSVLALQSLLTVIHSVVHFQRKRNVKKSVVQQKTDGATSVEKKKKRENVLITAGRTSTWINLFCFDQLQYLYQLLDCMP